MKRISIALIAALAFCTAAGAQDKGSTVQEVVESTDEFGKVVTTTTYETHSVRTNKFWDNWSLSAGVGVQMYMGENDKYMNLGDRLCFPTISLEVAKWLTPEFGLKLGTDFGKMKGLWQWYHPGLDTQDWGNALYREWSDTPYTTRDDPNGRWYYRQSTWTYNLYLLVMLDLCNAISGYKENRIWHTIIYGGGGIIGSFGYKFPENLPQEARGNATTYLSPIFNAGWLNTFRVAKNVDINIDIRGKLLSDKFDGESRDDEPDDAHFVKNIPIDGILGAAVGVTYHFAGSGKDKEWTEVKDVSTVHYYDKVSASNAEELKKYREQYESEAERNRSLAAGLGASAAVAIPDAWLHINFKLDKADISDAEMEKIAKVAEFIKATPDCKYLITGYCDVQTAKPAYNLKLSKKRSDAVYKALTEKFGVDKERLVCDYKGGVDTMFLDDPQFSRCVMITAVKK